MKQIIGIIKASIHAIGVGVLWWIMSTITKDYFISGISLSTIAIFAAILVQHETIGGMLEDVAGIVMITGGVLSYGFFGGVGGFCIWQILLEGFIYFKRRIYKYGTVIEGLKHYFRFDGIIRLMAALVQSLIIVYLAKNIDVNRLQFMQYVYLCLVGGIINWLDSLFLPPQEYL